GLSRSPYTPLFRSEVVGAVAAEPGGVAELEAVPGQGQDMACPRGAFQETFQQPGEGVEIHHVSFGDPVGFCPRTALRNSPKPFAEVVGPEVVRVGFLLLAAARVWPRRRTGRPVLGSREGVLSAVAGVVALSTGSAFSPGVLAGAVDRVGVLGAGSGLASFSGKSMITAVPPREEPRKDTDRP